MPILQATGEAEIKSSAHVQIDRMDTLGLSVLMTDTAIKENEEFVNSPLSMVDANGDLIDGLAGIKVCKYSFFATTYHSLD